MNEIVMVKKSERRERSLPNVEYRVVAEKSNYIQIFNKNVLPIWIGIDKEFLIYKKMNKKPISKIIEVGKIRKFALSDIQAQDSAFDIDLGDTVEITVIGKVVRSADAGENLFAFSREFAVESQDAFVKSIKKWEAEKAEVKNDEDQIEEDIEGLKKAGVKDKVSINAFRTGRRQVLKEKAKVH